MVPNSAGERWRFGLLCPHCNGSVIAPYCSEYLSEERVRHFWFCEDCGRQIEFVVDVRIEVSNLSDRVGACPVSLLA